VLECSENLSELAPTPIKTHRAAEYFRGPLALDELKPLVHEDESGEDTYHPLLLLDSEGERVAFYAKCSDTEFEGGNLAALNHSKVVQMISEINMVKFDFEFVRTYYLRLETALTHIYAKEFFVLLGLSLLFLAAIFAAQALLFSAIDMTFDYQGLVIGTCNKIVSFFNLSIKLGMDMNYIDLNSQISYSNNFTHVNQLN
jgi:hypothetical protein